MSCVPTRGPCQHNRGSQPCSSRGSSRVGKLSVYPGTPGDRRGKEHGQWEWIAVWQRCSRSIELDAERCLASSTQHLVWLAVPQCQGVGEAEMHPRGVQYLVVSLLRNFAPEIMVFICKSKFLKLFSACLMCLILKRECTGSWPLCKTEGWGSWLYLLYNLLSLTTSQKLERAFERFCAEPLYWNCKKEEKKNLSLLSNYMVVCGDYFTLTEENN